LRASLQLEIDKSTRVRLWNVLGRYYFDDKYNNTSRLSVGDDDPFLNHMWHNFFELSLFDLYKMRPQQVYSFFIDKLLSYDWIYVYDLIEEILTYLMEVHDCTNLIEHINLVLEKDMCAYRIIEKYVTPIITPTEITEIEEALQQPFDTVNHHLKTALELFSDRETPNYPNSVKESISAVEGICRIIVSDKTITLGQALRRLENSGISIHSALKSGLSSIYGWTSSDGGARHAKMDDSDIGFDEAKFMIVLCSAFVNFLILKAEKADIDLMANYNALKGKI